MTSTPITRQVPATGHDPSVALPSAAEQVEGAAVAVSAAARHALVVADRSDDAGTDRSALRAGLDRSLVALRRAHAALTAARVRVIAAADALGLPETSGCASTGAWLAQALQVTGRRGAAEVRLAIDLLDLPDVMDALDAGTISREHATSLVDAHRRQRDEAEAAAAAASEAEARRQREQEMADAAAQQAARDAAERQRLAREAAAAELARREQAAAAAEADRLAAEEAARVRQQQLLDQAAAGLSPDEVKRQGRRLAEDDARRHADEIAQRQRRSLHHWIDRDTNMGYLKLAVPLEQHHAILAAIAAATAPDPADTPEELRRTPAQRRADALTDLLDLAMSQGDRPRRGGEVPSLTVTIPAGALLDEPALGGHGEPGITGHGGELSAAAVRRLGCDAVIVRAITSASSTILDAGRATRVWSTSQRRVIEARDRHCRFGNCTRPAAWCQIHHVTWWRHGGRTSTDNGVLLCSFHHHAVHDHGWTLTYDAATNTTTASRRDVTVSSPPPHLAASPPGQSDPAGPPRRATTTDRPPLGWDDALRRAGAVTRNCRSASRRCRRR